MADIQSLTISQTRSISIAQETTEIYERSRSGLSISASSVANQAESNSFDTVLDVIDISLDARQKLLQERADAESLAAIAAGEQTEVLSAPLVLRNGRVEIDALAAQISEQFQISESFELDVFEETTLSVETDEGSFSITQSRLIEADFSSSFTFRSDIGVEGFESRLIA
ncbi:MAG: hypothetical protein AB8B83_02420 [Bdellovibrionales bacterium]